MAVTSLQLDRPRKLAAGGGLLGTIMVVAYVSIIASEGNNPPGQIVAWTLIMGLPSVLALASVLLPAQLARWTLLVATALFGGLVMLTSLGLGFLLAGVLTGIAAYKVNESMARKDR